MWVKKLCGKHGIVSIQTCIFYFILFFLVQIKCPLNIWRSIYFYTLTWDGGISNVYLFVYLCFKIIFERVGQFFAFILFLFSIAVSNRINSYKSYEANINSLLWAQRPRPRDWVSARHLRIKFEIVVGTLIWLDRVNGPSQLESSAIKFFFSPRGVVRTWNFEVDGR